MTLISSVKSYLNTNTLLKKIQRNTPKYDYDYFFEFKT